MKEIKSAEDFFQVMSQIHDMVEGMYIQMLQMEREINRLNARLPVSGGVAIVPGGGGGVVKPGSFIPIGPATTSSGPWGTGTTISSDDYEEWKKKMCDMKDSLKDKHDL